jgi:hypothetical protein
MPDEKYTSVPLDEENDNDMSRPRQRELTSIAQVVKNVVFLTLFAVVWFIFGLGIGHTRSRSVESFPSSKATENGLLPPQAFIL